MENNVIIMLVGFLVSFEIYDLFKFIISKKRQNKYKNLHARCSDLASEWDEKNLKKEIDKYVREQYLKGRLVFSFDEIYKLSANYWFVKKLEGNYDKIVKGNKKITLDNYCEKSDLIRIFNEI